MDDSNVCFKKTDAELFHQHLNSVDGNIQFIIERACQSIFFLDSRITVLCEGSVEIDVHWKTTHTNKYLDCTSHNPVQHKEAVIKTLFQQRQPTTFTS